MSDRAERAEARVAELEAALRLVDQSGALSHEVAAAVRAALGEEK